MVEHKEAFDKITKAKARMIVYHPFYGSIAVKIPLVEAPWVGTMATDMTHIYYAPKFVMDHSLDEIIGVMAHEILHVVWLHGTRRGHRDHKLWNIACDYAINITVTEGGLRIPADGFLDLKYKNMSAQEIYEDLLKNPPQQQFKLRMPGQSGENGDGDDEGSWGAVFDPQSGDKGQGGRLSQSEVSQLEHEVKIMVQQAAENAKSRGKLPGGLEGLIQASKAPTIDWKNYIQTWVRGHTPDDYTWSRPNRVMLANHRVYMPSVVSNGSGIGVLSIDTSGSVSDKELVQYITEIVGLIEGCKPDKLIIVQHDSILQKVDIWEAGMDFSGLKVKGRGGTCIMPVFKYIQELDDDISWMICFTDMGIGDYPGPADQPHYPVLWAATGPNNVDFGTYVPIKDAYNG